MEPLVVQATEGGPQMIPTILVKALLAKVLLDPRTKDAVFGALEKEAKKTETVIDDQVLAVAKVVWDTIVPAMLK
jgi:ActR/RegA family two-component response regulator